MQYEECKKLHNNRIANCDPGNAELTAAEILRLGLVTVLVTHGSCRFDSSC